MQIDGSLIRKCRQKKRQAQLELYRRCYPFLMKVCLRYKKNQNDAAEILNQGMLRILENLHRYPDGAPFEAWAKKVMVNMLIDDYRKHRKRKEMMHSMRPSDLVYYEQGHTHNASAIDMEAEGIRKLINTLPEERKQIFNLFALDGFAHKEISEMLGINENTSRWHVREARKYLKARIKRATAENSVKNESI